jgi:hypothetical protein
MLVGSTSNFEGSTDNKRAKYRSDRGQKEKTLNDQESSAQLIFTAQPNHTRRFFFFPFAVTDGAAISRGNRVPGMIEEVNLIAKFTIGFYFDATTL